MNSYTTLSDMKKAVWVIGVDTLGELDTDFANLNIAKVDMVNISSLRLRAHRLKRSQRGIIFKGC